MKKLIDYLKDAESFESPSIKDQIEEMYRENPCRFEEMWMETIQNNQSLDIDQFERLLEERGLYLQLYNTPRRFKERDKPSIYMELRIYPYRVDKRVAVLKVTIN